MARTAKLAKRMETTKKFCEFEGLGPATAIFFPCQLTTISDKYGGSKGRPLWLQFIAMTKSYAMSLTIWIIPKKNPGHSRDSPRRVKRQPRNYAYIKAANDLLNQYANSGVDAKRAAEIETRRRRHGLTGVNFTKHLNKTTLRCVDAYSQLRSKSIVVEVLPLNLRENMRSFYAANPSKHFCQLAQNVNTVLRMGNSEPSLAIEAEFSRSVCNDGRNNCQQNQESKQFRAQSDKTHAVGVPDRSSSAVRMRVPGRTTRKTIIKQHLLTPLRWVTAPCVLLAATRWQSAITLWLQSSRLRNVKPLCWATQPRVFRTRSVCHSKEVNRETHNVADLKLVHNTCAVHDMPLHEKDQVGEQLACCWN